MEDRAGARRRSGTEKGPDVSVASGMYEKTAILMSFFLIGFPLLFLYAKAFQWLIGSWSDSRAFSHGFLIPFVLLYVVWIRRDLYKTLDQHPNYLSGGLIMFFCAIMLIVGRLGPVIQIEAISLLFFLPGMVLFVFGAKYLKELAFPLIYAQFLVPWMEEFLGSIPKPFQYISAEIAAMFLKLMGYNVLLEEIRIELPELNMRVAQACSGVHFLTGVLAFGLLLVYLSQKNWTRATLVLLLGSGLTILANGFRVAMAGVEGSHFGTEMLHGPGHILRGSVVVWAGVIGVFLVNWLVAKVPPKDGLRLYERWKARHAFKKQETKLKLRPFVYFFIIAALFGIYLNIFAKPKPVALKRPLVSFPTRLGEWQGWNNHWFDGETFFPGADEQVVRTYKNNSGRTVNLYVAYFESQTEGKRLISFHSKPLHEHRKTIAARIDSEKRRQVNHALFAVLENVRYESVFWYEFSFGTVADRYRAKLMPISDGFLHRRNNGAVILAAAPLDWKESETSRKELLLSFLRDLAPELENFLPFQRDGAKGARLGAGRGVTMETGLPASSAAALR